MTEAIIRVLDSQTANQIAAGEVVEGPASVIKELVENAIDAGATEISVKILDSAAENLQVFDNGCGMVPQDMQIAVKRHATSKICAVEDINNIATLGFRGEALAAIAAVSLLSLSSRTPDAVCGKKISVKTGQISEVEDVAMPYGTIIKVEKLFYNTPARKKFLKSPLREVAKISDYLAHLALSNPQIAFLLEQEGKKLLQTNGSGDLFAVALAVYGKETVKKLQAIKGENAEAKIFGLISLPELNRSTRQGYNFFINNRWVQSKELSRAVDEAYYTMLPKGRYPLVIIFVELPPNQIDVNIHPTKAQVKLKDYHLLSAYLIRAIQNTLYHQEALSPELQIAPADQQNKQKEDLISQMLEENRPLTAAEPLRALSLKEALYGGYKQTGHSLYHPPVFYQQQADETAKKMFYSALAPLGQLDSSYLLVGGDDALYIIDQHAAHERILYEKIKNKAQESLASMPLLIPQVLELTQTELAHLSELIIQLTDLGFIVEDFGDNTFLIRNVPAWYEGNDAAGLLRDLLAQAADKTPDSLKITADEKIFRTACRRAVKANQYLSNSQISALLVQLDQCENPATCPHGRPVCIKIPLEEIKRRFLRDGN
ncbi:MAG: DNA mismatch repair endonuclease MutL [Clostridia bacterium]|nr:DNA mismatch repair endonuclease MutL [Clostridia bacterium]MDD4798570.1 DNA mismatch repair endonuclease MutL [Clostridia bacterium]